MDTIELIHERFPEFQPELPITPSAVNLLKDQHFLSSLAIESMSVFVLCHQLPEMRRVTLTNGVPFRADMPDITQEVESAAKASWAKGLSDQAKHWKSLGKPADDRRVQGLFTASIYRVHGILMDATGNAQPIIIPPRYTQEYPKFFGRDRFVLLEDDLL